MKIILLKNYWYCVSISILLLMLSCQKNNKIVSIDPEFGKYIQAYTSGVISKKKSIRIQFTSNVNVTHALNETIQEKLFTFSPGVKGNAIWIDERTIEFKPEKDFTPDQLYEISFDLSKIMDVPARFRTFTFNVQIIKPAYSVDLRGLRAESGNNDKMRLSGTLFTADVEENEKVEKLLTINTGARFAQVKWSHNTDNKVHSFLIDSIERKNTSYPFKLNWNGDAINASSKEEKSVEIPAIGDFKVLNVIPVQEEEEYALVQFSDPLAINQDLKGLILISDQQDVSYAINGSEVKVYASKVLDGNYKVSINQGIVNEWGKKIENNFSANVFFENRLPFVKIQGRGNILPNSSGKLLLPFEATNLRAVDVSIIKIYENNIAQFLQSNDFNGDQFLRQVATPVVKATIQLDDDQGIDLHKKNRFSLDIDKYIKSEPGAMYRVNIGFRPDYSLYSCGSRSRKVAVVGANGTVVDSSIVEGDEVAEDEELFSEEGNNYDYVSAEGSVDSEEDFWSRYDTYYPYGYSWSQRNNPCSKSYYNKERFATRNILATNIGLTAKLGAENSLLVVASNILSAKPFASIQLEVLDYQRQIVGTATTDKNGMALLQLKRKGFLLVAKNGNEKSYLKLDEVNALPLSRFDVSGAEVKNGIKGFIFGERGVWRPGDSLFLNCIIEDKANKLPDNHPVELELYTPNGQLYKKLMQPNAVGGFNVFRTNTDAGAPTGNWTCKAKVGGAIFEKKIKIESIMPNRLKIDLDFGQNTELGIGYSNSGTLSAKWLFGAIAKKLKAKVDLQLYKSTTEFTKFKDYAFDNPATDFAPQTKSLYDGILSEEGKATINAGLQPISAAPGILRANLLVKVFEPGGNFSIDNVSYPFHPYASYLGIKVPEGQKPWGYLAAAQNQTINIVNVDTKGNLIAGNQTATVELYKIQWRWWWDNTGDELSNFTTDRYNKLIKKENVTLTNGKGGYTFNIPSDEWGRYLVLVRDLKSGHVTGKTFYVDDPFWQTRNTKDDPTAASMLSFTSDKEKYNVGEDVQLTIPTSKGGMALISIETGSKVIKSYWVETQQGQTKYSFKAEKGMAPNIYVNISLLQPHAQTINDLPIRMYGVIPVMIEDKATTLNPVIKMTDVIKPEQQSAVTVSEAGGKDMSYVIAIVDEGLLDITRFKTPDPHKAFYAKEALGVKSWDLFDYVIGAWGGGLERILTIGGDSEAAPAGNKKANRFPPVVKFMGPFRSNGKSVTHQFTLPSYMGSVRVMVIAANNGAYGFSEKSVTVKKPLMLLATLPRVLGPEEQIKIPVTVFATENNIRNVSLSLQSNPYLDPVGGNTKTLNFNGSGEQQVYFEVKVKPYTGVGVVKLIATSGVEKTTYDVEIDIRNPNPVVTNITEQTLAAGQNYSAVINALGAGSKAMIEVSSVPAINLQKRLQYLIEYPHGCIEQTTSAVFPQLVLNQLLELNDKQKATVETNIRSAIEKIKNFQTKDGGFSYWPSESNSDEWGTSYAGHFLIEAMQRGYNVPANMLQQWKTYERNKSNSWNVTQAPYYGSDLSQAYRLYLLALSKSPELGAMNRLKEYRFITPEAKWRLAAAYYLVGQNGVALQMISGLTTNFNKRTDPGISYGSQLRDQAMVLETLTLMNRKSEADQLVKSISEQLSQQSWYSTQTTAYALVAISKYCGIEKTGNKINVQSTVSGKATSITSTHSLAQIPVSFSNARASVNISNKGKNVLYVRVINQGQPISGDTMSAVNHPEVLKMSTTYLNSSGVVIDPASIKQGTDFVAKVTVTNTGQRGTYNQMALSQIFPAGWEILNTRLYNSEGVFKSSPAEFMDIRDDRVYYYFDIKQNQTLTYYVQLNAAYPGRYYWPAVRCEAMYDNYISASSKGRWVKVNE